MPIFDIKVAGQLEPEQKKLLYSEVAKTISRIKSCPITAVSGSITELPLSNMGTGDKDWETILSEIE